MPFRSDRLLHSLALIAAVTAAAGRRHAVGRAAMADRALYDGYPSRCSRLTQLPLSWGEQHVALSLPAVQTGRLLDLDRPGQAIYGQIVRVDWNAWGLVLSPSLLSPYARRSTQGAHCSLGEQPRLRHRCLWAGARCG